MKVLFYLGHPAQFHFSKNIIRILLEDGHQVKILLKTKDVLEELVKNIGFEYENIQESVRKNNKFAILAASFKRMIKVMMIAKRFNADILAGTDSSIAQAAYFLRKPSLTTLEDDYNVIKNLAKLTYPFSTHIIVPSVCDVCEKWNKKKIPYYGYMKLAYLHPNRFTPDEDIKKKYINATDFCIIRLAKLTAHHDSGIKGLNNDIIKKTIQLIEEKGYSVYISSESEFPENLEKYRLKINPNDIHHVLFHTSLFISDSQSMSVETALLGVPSIRFSDFAGKISVLEELEHIYKLTFGITTNEPEKLLILTNKLLSEKNIKATFNIRRQKMLSEKIDVTAFFVWFIENYPQSAGIMKENPDYQNIFK